jgi:hypothetical protein
MIQFLPPLALPQFADPAEEVVDPIHTTISIEISY